MEPIRTGIVGFGRMASNHHLGAMRDCELYDIQGVCDITESRREAAAEEGLRATDSLDELLSWDVEFVLITTHSSAHYADALRVAEAKRHTLIEKPMALEAAQAEEMLSAAKTNGVTLTVYHNRHFDNDYRRVKSAVEDGLVGDLVYVENRTMGARPAVGFGVPDYNQAWRITASAGGGTMFDFGPHWVEQVLDLFDGKRVVQIFADVRHIKWGDAEDLFDITMIFEDGVRARAGKADISYAGLPYKWFVLGTEATLTDEGGRGETVTVWGEDYELRRSKAIDRESLHVNIAEHLREGKDLIITGEHALRVMQVLDAARKSAKLGKSLDVDI